MKNFLSLITILSLALIYCPDNSGATNLKLSPDFQPTDWIWIEQTVAIPRLTGPFIKPQDDLFEAAMKQLEELKRADQAHPDVFSREIKPVPDDILWGNREKQIKDYQHVPDDVLWGNREKEIEGDKVYPDDNLDGNSQKEFTTMGWDDYVPGAVHYELTEEQYKRLVDKVCSDMQNSFPPCLDLEDKPRVYGLPVPLQGLPIKGLGEQVRVYDEFHPDLRSQRPTPSCDVPEPATALLLGLGMLGGAIRRKRN